MCAATKSFHGLPQVYCRKGSSWKLPKASEAFFAVGPKSFRSGGSFCGFRRSGLKSFGNFWDNFGSGGPLARVTCGFVPDYTSRVGGLTWITVVKGSFFLSGKTHTDGPSVWGLTPPIQGSVNKKPVNFQPA